MLDQMRSAAKSWISRLFLGLLLASFLVWGVPSTFLPQAGGGELFSSGGSSADTDDYIYQMRDLLARMGGTKSGINAASLRGTGLIEATLQRLRANVLLDEEVRRMKIGADENAALQLLARDRLFHNENGDFDRNIFDAIAFDSGLNQAIIIENMIAQARRSQLLDAIVSDMVVPDVFYGATVLYEQESRGINYVKIVPSLIDEPDDPAEDALETWFEEHQVQFVAPEYRTLTYMPLKAESLADEQSVDDARLQVYYDANKMRFGEIVPERREFDQLRFESRADADAAYARLVAGASFDELIHEQGRTPDDVRRGPLSRDEMSSLLGAEVFALTQGEVSAVVNDLGGPVILRLGTIEAERAPSLADVAGQLRQELALVDGVATMRRLAREIEDARFEGATLAELAQQYDLPLRTVTVDVFGRGENVDPMQNIDEAENMEMDDIAPLLRGQLLVQSFASQPGIDRDPVVGQDSYVWYQVDAITPARDRSLDEVQIIAITQWKQQEILRLLVDRAENLKVQLESGKSLEQLAEENKLTVERATGLQRRGVTSVSGLSPELVEAVFSVTPPRSDSKIHRSVGLLLPEMKQVGNEQKESSIQDGFLFQVTDSAEPLSLDPQSLTEQQRNRLSVSLSQDMVGQFLLQAHSEHGVDENQALLREVLNNPGLIFSR